jgi:aspartate carbamoyltransferase catalytic subunit
VINDLDVLYVTRIQKERHSDAIDYSYIIAPNTIKDAKQSLTIMHPLPRVGEIHTSVDDDPRAAYFRQMKNGLWIRMALLTYLLDN